MSHEWFQRIPLRSFTGGQTGPGLYSTAPVDAAATSGHRTFTSCVFSLSSVIPGVYELAASVNSALKAVDCELELKPGICKMVETSGIIPKYDDKMLEVFILRPPIPMLPSFIGRPYCIFCVCVEFTFIISSVQEIFNCS